MEERLKNDGLSFATVYSRDDVYFVARNPYTRLLSLYLDKVLRCFGVGAKKHSHSTAHSSCDHDLLATSGAFAFPETRQAENAPRGPVRSVSTLPRRASRKEPYTAR